MTKHNPSSSSPGNIAESRRRAPRVPLDVAAAVEHEGQLFQAFAKNAGVGGAFVETSAALPYGAKVILHVSLPSASGALRLPGIVRWSNESGIGIQFQELGARETHALSALIAAAS